MRVALPAAPAATGAIAPVTSLVSPADVSYEPMLASALRHTWTFLSKPFRRGGDAEGEPVGGAGGTVTVQKGDTLSKIAQRTLGSADRWRAIYELNRDKLNNPNLIHPGQVLRLPGGAAPAPAPAPAPSSGSVTVQRGDTLSKIAQRTLGRADRWPEIYNANRDKISNPNIVWPGLTLRVPGGASSPSPAPSAPSGKLPWPVNGRQSSPYGMRRHPISGQHKLHTGLDIAAASGTPVKVPRAGKVTFAGWSGGYGNYVVIDHGNGLTTAYAHLSAINVRSGQQVNAGAQLGKVGSTGMSTGPHLHFEVKRNGQFVDPKTMLG